MNLVPGVAAVYEQMAAAKRGGAVTTNFYPTPEKLERWTQAGELFSLAAGDVLFFLRRDRDFFHVYYQANRAEELGPALAQLAGQSRETLTADVIGKPAQVDQIAALFGAAGFRPHTLLRRMTLVRTEAPPMPDDAEVVWAGPEDGAALSAMLEAMLDRHAEQIPDTAEMAEAAAARKVLVIRAGNAIAGQLFFEATGQSSILRHWVVNAAFRDRRIGARLMHRYFAECKDVRRFTLWVISDNDNAIDRYKHYGYQHDGLIDQVLMRQAV